MEENTTTKILAIGPNLTQAWELYKKHWQLLVPASIIVFIPDLLSMLMGDDKTAAAGLFSLLLSVCSLFLASGSIYFGLKLIRSGEAEITDLFSQKDSFIQFFLGNLVVGIITFLGLLLLVIPGIVFATRYSLVPFLIIDKKLDFKAAMSESKRLTEGKKMQLFKYYFATGIIAAAGALLVGVGLLVTAPIAMLMGIAAYEELA